ncbi:MULTISPECIES: Cys-tRNA(Pro) deacylase [unclassified Pseudoalteromonas]|uniref:Cys-tRNA(Pro) deacylase n=1 Tax=Pseudoalteromonas TaxID=53246 RepID=UPI001604074B|nr:MULTISPECIES: Cys-tRNA(Pro) deacylase [unclassified Pseudoalteromonas]MBB1278851.1 Cys-tRNA(Pro) deacylase [Pseudoalteromonas sp. SR41-1]MBB1297352.1 Cys-tRNA(Pro) deacylase [Pseudoalteromonas sp. SR41-7]MBB1348176.1 Cys-tRNA(Pro) deacylase [Pseudoalteromonas sp. SG45-2]MBB1349214.1 Cys-tRNA(Pro) deacylase [Pseudoalteromonas sp. SG45-3]MBB1358387.1 Cys-tRNA(Pro) deacylase [Pseudoalteromonas sp. SG45-6]
MTPAIELLKKQKIPFEVLSYDHDAGNSQYGLEAVEKLNLDSAQVYKTLVLETHERQLIVAVTPVSQQVNLKQLAKLCGAKKVAMAAPQKVQASTGYILGGVSPLGQKKRLATFIHSSASLFDTIYVSAGKRGLEIALSPTNLAALTSAKFGDL